MNNDNDTEIEQDINPERLSCSPSGCLPHNNDDSRHAEVLGNSDTKRSKLSLGRNHLLRTGKVVY